MALLAEIELTVKLFGGGEYKFHVNLDSTTVKDLKVLLAPETGLPVDDQILVYDGETLSDTQTLREAGIQGNWYKVILGSKSSTPSTDDSAGYKPPESSSIGLHMHYTFKGLYRLQDGARMTNIMNDRLEEMQKAVNFDHLEKVAADSWKIHEEVLSDRRDFYYKTFKESYHELQESDKLYEKMKRERERVAKENAAKAEGSS